MATVNLAISNALDDGYEVVGDTVYTDDVKVFSGYDSGEWIGFLRFLSVAIPQGETINSAILTVNVIDVVGTPNTTWYGVAVDDAAQFTAPGNLPSVATPTTASVDGDPAGTGTRTFELATIIQEIVNRAGWLSGNDIGLICRDNAGTGINYWTFEDFDDVGTAHATLDITYGVVFAGATSTYRRQANARLGMRRG